MESTRNQIKATAAGAECKKEIIEEKISELERQLRGESANEDVRNIIFIFNRTVTIVMASRGLFFVIRFWCTIFCLMCQEYSYTLMIINEYMLKFQLTIIFVASSQ